MAKQKAKVAAQAKNASHQTAVSKRSKALKRDGVRVSTKQRGLNPAGLSALPPPPKVTYKSDFIKVPNLDKQKKKLEYRMTKDRNPPPGFTFVPVGNPELSRRCKDKSRDNDYLIFIVTHGQENSEHLYDHVKRIGFHFRSSVVDEATTFLGGVDAIKGDAGLHQHPSDIDKIPETQAEIDKQADAVLRDLFPRIPNIDREQIISHAFQKGARFNGELVVGMQQDLTLSRRVQLAANAHIRHTHTEYDKLLRQTNWAHARKIVEPACLDIIMKWRGDEETGRDQLDEILREVVILDSDDDDDAPEAAPESMENASDEEVQFLREVAASQAGATETEVGQATDESLGYTPYNKLRRPMNDPTLETSATASNLPRPDNPEYAQQQNRQPKKNRRDAQRNKKRSKQEKEVSRDFARYRAWEEAQQRQNAREAQRGQDTNNENQHGVSREHQNRQGPTFTSYTPTRRPLQVSRFEQTRNNEAPPVEREYAPVSQSAQQNFNQPGMVRHERQVRNGLDSSGSQPIATYGLPTSIREVARPVHYDQAHPISPIRDNAIARSIEGVECIDLTDSPAQPARQMQQDRFNKVMPPHRVMTFPQNTYKQPYEQQAQQTRLRDSLQTIRNVTIIRDDDDDSIPKAHRRNDSANQMLYGEPPTAHPRVSQRQEAQNLSSSMRVFIPPSQPDTSWVPEPHHSNEPILITSSPYSDPRPAYAPPARFAALRGERMGLREVAPANTAQAPMDRGEFKALPSGYRQQLDKEQPSLSIKQRNPQDSQDQLPMESIEVGAISRPGSRAQPRYVEQYEQAATRYADYDPQPQYRQGGRRLVPAGYNSQGIRIFREAEPEPVMYHGSRPLMGTAQRPIYLGDRDDRRQSGPQEMLPVYGQNGYQGMRVVSSRPVYGNDMHAQKPVYDGDDDVEMEMESIPVYQHQRQRELRYGGN